MEDRIYFWIGLLAVWLGIGYLAVKIIGFILIALINWAGDKFDKMWLFMEFLYYRKEFKDWIKDKQRHPRMNKH